jgi:hypothetical protein
MSALSKAATCRRTPIEQRPRGFLEQDWAAASANVQGASRSIDHVPFACRV